MSLEAEAERQQAPAVPARQEAIRFSPRVEFVFRFIALLILLAATTVSVWVISYLVSPILASAVVAMIILVVAALASRHHALRLRVETLERELEALKSGAATRGEPQATPLGGESPQN